MVTVQLVVLMPALFALMFAGVQAAMFYHGRTVAIAAAEPLAVCTPLQKPGSARLAAGSMNATNVRVAAGCELPAAQLDRDVALVVTGGAGVLVADDVDQALAPGLSLIMRAGSTRSIRAGADGLQLTTAHVRR